MVKKGLEETGMCFLPKNAEESMNNVRKMESLKENKTYNKSTVYNN